MIKKAITLALAAASAWQLLRVVKQHLDARRARVEQKEAVSTWENEGGQPAPARRHSGQGA